MIPPLLPCTKTSCTPCRMTLLFQLLPAGSGQALLRHPRGTAYRCYLPVLAGFTGSCRVGPNPPHHSTPVVQVIAYPRGGIRPRYSGFRVQGAATSPSSTTRLWYLIWGQKSNHSDWRETASFGLTPLRSQSCTSVKSAPRWRS